MGSTKSKPTISLMQDAIDVNDNFELPSGYRFSRQDVEILLQQPRFIQQPYDPYTNVPPPPNQVNAIF